jgi:hypothetical protein
MPPGYCPRLSIEITEEQQEKLRAINLPHGWQKALFSYLLDEIIALHDENGIDAIAVLVGKLAKPRDVIPSLALAANSHIICMKGGKQNE